MNSLVLLVVVSFIVLLLAHVATHLGYEDNNDLHAQDAPGTVTALQRPARPKEAAPEKLKEPDARTLGEARVIFSRPGYKFPNATECVLEGVGFQPCFDNQYICVNCGSHKANHPMRARVQSNLDGSRSMHNES